MVGSIEEAMACQGRGEYERVEAICRDILTRHPYHADALNLFGAAALGRDRPLEALDYIDRAIKAAGNVSRYHHNRAVALQTLQRDDEAILSYRTALMLAPGNRSARNRLRHLLIAHDRLQEVAAAPAGAPRPRVLAFTTAIDGVAISRLPALLLESGIEVASLGPRGSFLDRTRFVRERFRPSVAYTPHDILTSLVDAAAVWDPLLIIPGDEAAVHLLHAFHRSTDPPVPPRLRELIGRSCGEPLAYGIAKNKHQSVAAAAALGIPTPLSRAVASAADVQAAAADWGFPLVLKGAHGASGLQVRVCRDRAEVEAAGHHLANPPFLVVDGADRPLPLQLQPFIAGRPTSTAFVALAGVLLDSFAYEQVEALLPFGPSSVIRHLASPEPAIGDATRALVRRFGFTGFGGVDFVVDRKSGQAVFLEFNPRVTSATHLGRLFGHDLAAALQAGLTGAAVAPPVSPQAEIVAIHPYELQRDPASRFLREAYVDAPLFDPDLLDGFGHR